MIFPSLPWPDSPAGGSEDERLRGVVGRKVDWRGPTAPEGTLCTLLLPISFFPSTELAPPSLSSVLITRGISTALPLLESVCGFVVWCKCPDAKSSKRAFKLETPLYDSVESAGGDDPTICQLGKLSELAEIAPLVRRLC